MKIATFDIDQVLRKLAEERQVFHSEADFQHSLAWRVRELHPKAKIRLEVPSGRFDRRERIDVLVALQSEVYALELKYKKKNLEITIADEVFSLRADVAHDISRYDFLKDVKRLEHYVDRVSNSFGYAVFLTNDKLYWERSERGAFFLEEGRVINSQATLTWHPNTGAGTKKSRESDLCLRGPYTIAWRDYSRGAEPASHFRYIALRITR